MSRRELLLLRHGKSDWDKPTDDFHRPLKNRGKRGAQRMGAWLAQQRREPQLIVTSPATRALATAEKCCKAMGLTTDNVSPNDTLYHGSPQALLDVIAATPNTIERLMIVGHNPVLEQLLEHIIDSPPTIPEDGKLLPTATLARIAIPTDWANIKPHAGQLREIIRAKSLPKLFPYPFPDGPECRERPAYYYTQSAVIPFRIHQDQLQVLIIGSSSNRHWSIPKGIAEPGMSLQDSAQKEALEEAGITGKVEDEAIGVYVADKWGGQCQVTVFPMRVNDQQSQQEREEPHRSRQWTTPEQAAELLKHPDVADMVLRLKKRYAP